MFNKYALQKNEIIARLDDCGRFPKLDWASRSKDVIAQFALDSQLVTQSEFNDSVTQQVISRKRYLRSVVTNPVWLDITDDYVQLASFVRSAGSKLANLFAIEAYERGWLDGPSDTFVGATLLDQTFVKYLLLPFKSRLSGAGNCDPRITELFERHADVLQCLYPSDAALRRVPWDQPLNDMSMEYMGALKAHVTTHLAARVNAWAVRRLIVELGVRRVESEGRAQFTWRTNGGGGGDVRVFASVFYEWIDSSFTPSERATAVPF